MKNIFGVIVAICLTVAFVSCTSAPPASEGIQNARSGAPSGALVASGTDKDAASAEKAAKLQLIRAMTSMATNMLQEASAAGEISGDAASGLVQGTSTALSRSSMSSAIKQGNGVGKGNVAWAVYYMEKPDVIAELNTAINAAKQITPDSASFTINSRIDAEFQGAIGRNWSN
jgi:hypothetical protein